MTLSLDDLTARLLNEARKAGADAADALAIDGTSISIDVREGALEHAERSEGIDLGLRVLIGQRQACVSASDASPETLATMAERAVAMAREAPEDPSIGLADPEQLTTSFDVTKLELFDPTPEPSPADLERDAQIAEARAQNVSGVTQVSGASAGYGHQRLHLTASNGFSGGYARTSRNCSVVAISGEGSDMERDYDGDARTFQADMRTPEDIGKTAGERAVARHGARKPKTGAFPVLFDERISSSLVGHLLSAINGAAVARGASWLRDAMEEQVLPAHLSLVENPHRPRMGGSRPFDAEGLPTVERAVVEKGTLKNWTLDLGTARKLGLRSTGNATRGTSGPPSPSASNMSLTQGDKTRDDLIRDMGTGLLVTSMIGSTINPNTGDYSRGASGFWIESGAIAYPVNECTIAGNLRDMLMSLIPADDARMHLSHIVPSLLVEGMTLAGE